LREPGTPNHRDSIGQGKPAPVPDWLDYSLWQGPRPNGHSTTTCFTTIGIGFGAGAQANSEIMACIRSTWHVGACSDYPERVTCGGNRYHFKDDQETPDIYVASFDFGEKGIAWEGQSCDPRGFEGAKFGVNFYGEKGPWQSPATIANFTT